jgi:hypothetical protein
VARGSLGSRKTAFALGLLGLVLWTLVLISL